MEVRPLKILVARSNKDQAFDEYEVPVTNNETTVMDILDYIFQNLDKTLAYYKHSTCNQGICGRCGVRLNGKNVLACTAKIDSALSQITLEPRSDRIVRDLVVEG